MGTRKEVDRRPKAFLTVSFIFSIIHLQRIQFRVPRWKIFKKSINFTDEPVAGGGRPDRSL